ncbi:energy transducer TonB [Polyangium aurulentum]|uniref:energy transducer TonB n=1 Tax=Polyangium aurulentum TaxID=2567896 RepID=UPI0010ADDDB3|nr:energy transducer TonB [Polyangium aurulentum]UQA59557.1 TonB family protein [Polyangium aurulentum]
MSEPRRMLDEGGNGPALALLRAARADVAPPGAKARARVALGLDAPAKPAVAARGAERAAPRKRVAGPALFQSVLGSSERPNGLWGTGRLGTAAFVAAQAAVVALLLASQPMRRMELPPSPTKSNGGVDIGFYAPPAGDPAPAPAAAAPAQKPSEPRAVMARPSRQPEALQEAVAEEGHPAALAQTSAAEGEAKAPDLPAKPEVREAVPAVVEVAPGLPARLVRKGGRFPSYTREALAARVEGTVLVKCVVGTDGALSNCRILKSVPHMDDAVLGAMATWRFEPIVSGGRPIAVDHVFTLRLVLPK